LLELHFKLQTSARYRRPHGRAKVPLAEVTGNLSFLGGQSERIFCTHYVGMLIDVHVILYGSFHASTVSCGPAGRCSNEKNHTMLLNVFAQEPRARLLILGGGPLLASTRRKRNQLVLTNVVQLLSSSDRALSLLDQAGFFVLAFTLRRPVHGDPRGSDTG
jgi:hypothetical protein